MCARRTWKAMGGSYILDKGGKCASKENLLTGVTENYTYDAIYQLTQVVQGANTTENYTYDPAGNRLSSLGLSPYNYNVSKELTATPRPSLHAWFSNVHGIQWGATKA